MQTPDTPAAASGILINESTAAQAFENWEKDFRADPAGFYTADETARMEVADVSTARAIHFMALLRKGGAA
jgi:hypothetical protein